jgi:hypothetical protein
MVAQRLSAEERRRDCRSRDELTSSAPKFEHRSLLLVKSPPGLVIGQLVRARIDLRWGHRNDDVSRDGRLPLLT